MFLSRSFQNYLAMLSHFHFHLGFKISLSICTKQLAGILLVFLWIYRSIGGKLTFFKGNQTFNSLNREHACSVSLFVLLAIFASVWQYGKSVMGSLSCHLGLPYWNLCFCCSLLLYGLTRGPLPRFRHRRGGGERKPDTDRLLIPLTRVPLRSLCVCA